VFRSAPATGWLLAAGARPGSAPVFITDRGRPAHVLLTFEAYEKLLGAHVLDRLAEPADVEDIDLHLPRSDDRPEGALFD
jgi:hypothetical protein